MVYWITRPPRLLSPQYLYLPSAACGQLGRPYRIGYRLSLPHEALGRYIQLIG